jgi:hypothetical protein
VQKRKTLGKNKRSPNHKNKPPKILPKTPHKTKSNPAQKKRHKPRSNITMKPQNCFECILERKLKTEKELNDLDKVDCPEHPWAITRSLAATQAVCDDRANAEVPELPKA